MSKELPIVLRRTDICIKCSVGMPPGTEVTWLRDAEAKGYYHPACAALPNVPSLLLVKKPTTANSLGYVWERAGGSVPTLMPMPVIPAAKEEDVMACMVDALMPKIKEKLLANPGLIKKLLEA